MSQAYLDNANKHLPVPTGYPEKDPLIFALRRKISWGPKFRRQSLPSVLRNPLYAHLTVFSIDEYWCELHHLLYPVFQSGDDLYFSLQIGTAGGVNNFMISQLLQYLSEIEAALKMGASAPEDHEKFDERLFELAQNGQLKLESQAQYFSPGVLWASLAGAALVAGQTEIACVLIAYRAIFGGKDEGILDLKTRQKFFSVLINRWEKHHGDKIKQNLEIEIPRASTRRLEEKSLDSKPIASLPAPSRKDPTNLPKKISPKSLNRTESSGSKPN